MREIRSVNRAVKNNGVRLVLSFVAVWLACSAYVQPFWLQMVPAVPAAFLLMRAWRRRQAVRQRALVREQFKWFLELLLSRLTAGATLERAFSDAIPGMQQMLSSKAVFLKALRTLDQQLQARRSLDMLLPALVRQLDLPEARYFFQMLPDLQQTGSQVTPFIRHYLRMVSEQLALQQSVGSETAQRRSEAMILAVMPFALAVMIRAGFDQQTALAMGRTGGTAGLLLSCLIALTALLLTCHLMIFDPDQTPAGSVLPIHNKQPGRYRRRLSEQLCTLYRSVLPAAYSARLLQYLFSLEQRDGNNTNGQDPDLTAAFFLRKLDLMLIGLIPATLFCLAAPSGLVLLLVIPVVLALLHDRQLWRLHRQQMSEYQMMYPVLINMLTALLQAGLSPHRAFQVTATCLLHKPHQPFERSIGLLADLTVSQRRIQAGQPIRTVLQDLLIRCPLPEAQAALLLLLRYEQAGETETIQLLEMQSSACWSLHRNATRKHLAQQGLKLLLPMTLDLVAVLMTALLPAVMSLQGL